MFGTQCPSLLSTSYILVNPSQKRLNLFHHIITMASANDSSKRRRLLSDVSSGIKCLSDLPNGVLTHAASYLALPSRPLFAVALSDQNASTASNERNTAIVDHEEWSTLDFGDIEKDLVTRLTDGDISSILICIDAVNKLKTLKLTNCLHITGAGLEPLRGSTMIKQIDLSLVGKNESPYLKPPPPISCEILLPILDSIIEREGCSLMHLQFPKVWRKEGSNVQFDHFLQRFDEMPNRGIISCCKRSCDLPPEHEHWIEISGRFYGSQNYTCCECLNYYCDECQDDAGEYWTNYCGRCERQLCVDCQSMKFCTECKRYYCVDCKDFIECWDCSEKYRCKDCRGDWGFCCKCERNCCGTYGYECSSSVILFYCQNDNCHMECCNDCEQEFGWPSCAGCDTEFCYDCNEKKKGMDAVRTCELCEIYYCGKCRVSMTGKEGEVCTGCIKMARRLLMEENKKVRKENKVAKAEIKDLKKQLKYERGRVKELAEEMKQISSRKS